MIVVFSTKFGRVTMFGEPAVALLRMAGHSGAIPGAILAPELPEAMRRLRTALETSGHLPSPAPDETETEPDGPDSAREKPVNLATRAVPLIELMERTAAGGADLMWDRG